MVDQRALDDILKQLQEKWQVIQDRIEEFSDFERYLLYTGVILAALMFIYLIIISPSLSALEKAYKKLNNEIKIYNWIQNNQRKLSQGASSQSIQEKQSLIAIINKSILKEPFQAEQLELRKDVTHLIIADADFNKVINWLATLQAVEHINIVSMQIKKTDIGKASFDISMDN